MLSLYNKFSRIKRLLLTQFFYKFHFESIGKKTIIFKPLKLLNSQNITIGDNVNIEENVTLYSVDKYNNTAYGGKIFVGDNTYINSSCNITAANEIHIEENVVIAFNVSFFDFNHNFDNIHIPVKYSNLKLLGKIRISRNCWIGMNVAIIGNVTLGEYCIVGANSVVTKSFPSYSIIAGVPAKIIKRYHFEFKKWKKTNSKGEFIDEI